MNTCSTYGCNGSQYWHMSHNMTCMLQQLINVMMSPRTSTLLNESNESGLHVYENISIVMKLCRDLLPWYYGWCTHMIQGVNLNALGLFYLGCWLFGFPPETGAHCLRAREISMATKIPDKARDIVACALLVTTFSGSAPQYFTAASAQSSKVGKLFKLPPQPP